MVCESVSDGVVMGSCVMMKFMRLFWMTFAAEVLAAAERREAVTTSEVMLLLLLFLLGNLVLVYGCGLMCVVEKLKVFLFGLYDGYVSLDEVTLDMAVDSGEKTRLI